MRVEHARTKISKSLDARRVHTHDRDVLREQSGTRLYLDERVREVCGTIIYEDMPGVYREREQEEEGALTLFLLYRVHFDIFWLFFCSNIDKHLFPDRVLKAC